MDSMSQDFRKPRPLVNLEVGRQVGGWVTVRNGTGTPDLYRLSHAGVGGLVDFSPVVGLPRRSV